MYSSIFEMLIDIMTSWREGRRAVRVLTSICAALAATAATMIVLAAVGITWFTEEALMTMGAVFGGCSAVIALGISVSRRSAAQAERERRMEQVARKVQENPKETQGAWELARTRLEMYLDRNLHQVRSIFWLTLVVMLVGFGLIAVGVYHVFETPGNLEASVLAAVSGIVVNFIGGTFLLIYRATMAQARDYVSILETIDETQKDLRSTTSAEITKQLLRMYANLYFPEIKRSRTRGPTVP